MKKCHTFRILYFIGTLSTTISFLLLVKEKTIEKKIDDFLDVIFFLNDNIYDCQLVFEETDAKTLYFGLTGLVTKANITFNNSGAVQRELIFQEEKQTFIELSNNLSFIIINIHLKFMNVSEAMLFTGMPYYIHLRNSSSLYLRDSLVSGEFTLKSFLASFNSSVYLINTTLNDIKFNGSAKGWISIETSNICMDYIMIKKFEIFNVAAVIFLKGGFESAQLTSSIIMTNSLIVNSVLNFIEFEGQIGQLSIYKSGFFSNLFKDKSAFDGRNSSISTVEFKGCLIANNILNYGWCDFNQSAIINVTDFIFMNNKGGANYNMSGFFLETSTDVNVIIIIIKKSLFIQNNIGEKAFIFLKPAISIPSHDMINSVELKENYFYKNFISSGSSQRYALLLINTSGELNIMNCFILLNKFYHNDNELFINHELSFGQIIEINSIEIKVYINFLVIFFNDIILDQSVISLLAEFISIEALVIGNTNLSKTEGYLASRERNLITVISPNTYFQNIVFTDNEIRETAINNYLIFRNFDLSPNMTNPSFCINKLYVISINLKNTLVLWDYPSPDIDFQIIQSFFIDNRCYGSGALFKFSSSTGEIPLIFRDCIFMNNINTVTFLLDSGTQSVFIGTSIIIDYVDGNGTLLFSIGSTESLFKFFNNYLLFNITKSSDAVINHLMGTYIDLGNTYFLQQAGNLKKLSNSVFSISDQASFLNTRLAGLSGSIVFIDAMSGSVILIWGLVLNGLDIEGNFFRGRSQAKLDLLNFTIFNTRVINSPLFSLTKMSSSKIGNLSISGSCFQSYFLKVVYAQEGLAFLNTEIKNCRGAIFLFTYSEFVEFEILNVVNCAVGANQYFIEVLSNSNVVLNKFSIMELEALEGVFLVIESEFSVKYTLIHNSLSKNYSSLSYFFTSSYSSIWAHNIISKERKYNLALIEKTYFSLVDSYFAQAQTSVIDTLLQAFIIATETPLVKLFSCNFENFRGFSGGVLFMTSLKNNFLLKSSQLHLKNCSFLNNAAKFGGAIMLEGIDAFIEECNFSVNQALDSGGAIKVICQLDDQFCETFFLRNNFFDNQAVRSGGAINWVSQEPENWQSNIYINNKAYYGNDLGSFPIRAALQKFNNFTKTNEPYSQEDYPLFMNISSGSALKEKIQIKLYDTEGRWVFKWPDEANPPIISLFDEVKEHRSLLPSDIQRSALIGALSPEISNGQIDFSDIIVRGEPGKVVTLKINFGIRYFPEFAGVLSNNEYVDANGIYHLLIDIHLRKCVLGEILVNDTQVCKLCEDNSYSLTQNSYRCNRCPYEFNCSGTEIISRVPGYWVLTGTDVIISCRMDQTQCLPGNKCIQGYTGLMCEKCDKGYYKIPGISCKNCELKWSQIIFLMMSHIQYLVAIVISLHHMSNISIESKEKSIARLIISYIHTASLFRYFSFPKDSEKNGNSFVNNVRDFPRILSFPSFGIDFTYSNSVLECLLSFDPNNIESQFFLKLLLLNLIPFFYVVGLLLFWLIKTPLSKTSNRFQYFKRNMIASIVTIYFTFEPSVLKNCLYAFSCLNVNNTFYLNFGLEVQCYTRQHLIWAATSVLPFAILVLILLPVIFVRGMKRINSSKRVKTVNAKFCYRFLLNGYKKEKYFWEFIIIGRKLIVEYIVLLMYHLDMRKCLFFTIVTLIIFIILQVKFKPYIWSDLNTLELYSLTSISSITFLYFYAHTKPLGIDNLILTLFCIVFHLAFLYKIFKYILHLTKFYYGKVRLSALKLSEAFVVRMERSFMKPKLSSRRNKFLRRSCFPRRSKSFKIPLQLLIPQMDDSITSNPFEDSSQENIILGSRSYKYFKFIKGDKDKESKGRRNRFTELMILSPQKTHLKRVKKEQEEDILENEMKEDYTRRELPSMNPTTNRALLINLRTEEHFIISNRSIRDLKTVMSAREHYYCNE